MTEELSHDPQTPHGHRVRVRKRRKRSLRSRVATRLEGLKISLTLEQLVAIIVALVALGVIIMLLAGRR